MSTKTALRSISCLFFHLNFFFVLFSPQANRQLRELREIAKGVTKQLPDAIQNATAKIDEYARGMISGSGSTLFEELGFYYIGPVDGHNLQDLIDVLTGKFSQGLVLQC